MEEPSRDHDHSQKPQNEMLEPIVGKISQHRFMALIGGSIVVALLLVVISMQLYFSSGTAQLDLSRPGFKSVRDQVKPEDTFDGFSANGAVDQKALDEFNQLYTKRAKEAAPDAFGSDVLSEQTLGIDAPAVEQ